MDNKSLLIDAVYVNCGGGLQLLRYLVSYLKESNKDFFLLQDSRVKDFDYLTNKTILQASLKARRTWYKHHGKDYSTVLCFGNVPPPIHLKAKVYTYFHNINILKSPPMFITWKVKLKNYMKQRVIDFYGKNTDAWIVQTENTKSELKKHLVSGRKQVLVLPFYRLSDELKEAKSITAGRTDYAFIGELSYPRGHGVILDVWKRLHEMGFDRTLHLTVSHDISQQKEYCQRVKLLQDEGVKIVNHGFVPFSDVVDIYKKTKAIVYPSLNESLGLSIIEAIVAGCDVLTADLPYAHAICKPSLSFDPTSVESICNTVIEYDTNGGSRSELTVEDMIKELVKVIA